VETFGVSDTAGAAVGAVISGSQQLDSTLKRMDEEIDLQETFLPLIAAWKFLLLLSIVGAILAFGVSFFLRPVYEANATLFVQSNSGLSKALGDLPIPIATHDTNSSYFVTLLQSRALADRVIDKLHLMNDPLFTRGDHLTRQKAVIRFQDNLHVIDNKSGSLVISVRAGSPRLAERIANCAIDALDKLVVTASRKKAGFTSAKIAETNRDLREAEDELRRFLEKNDIASVDYGTKAMIDELRGLEASLVENEIQLEQIDSDLRNGGDLSSLANKEVERRALESSRKYLLDRKMQLTKKLGRLPEIAAKYARIQRRLAVLSKTYEYLNQQYQMARVTQQGEDTDYQIVDRAEGLKRPVSPRKLVNAGIGGVVGFVLAVSIVNIKSSRGRQEMLRRAASRSVLEDSTKSSHLHV